ncbi:glycosyltransferase family 2 protein [Archaeoglobus neptunius]|nr:glycosyltransferase [Archaeoglobus neptunius]
MVVSVVIPTYNSEGMINICLKSIANQSYDDIEVIIVDRFSED